jgi:hypothetical protein
MAVQKPFKRTARQHIDGSYISHVGYVKHDQFAHSPATFVRAFEVLQKDVIALFDYVEPADKNAGCYSYRIHELHIRARIEVEANCRAILLENDYTKNWMTMSDYRKLEPTHHLSSFLVRLPLWNGGENPRRPFGGWKTANGILPWYRAYNSAKHSRHENFQESNLRNMLDAVCGLVAILAAQFIVVDFGQENYTGPSSTAEGFLVAIGQYFEVKFPDDWPSEERYDYDWRRLKQEPHPFQNLTFLSLSRSSEAPAPANAGNYYYEPPYTPEEDADFYRRVGGGPVAFTRPGPSRPAEAARSPGEQPTSKRQPPRRGKTRSMSG